MHPATIHQTTAKAPDSGLKLGFADISSTGKASVASLQNTPSRPRQSLARTNISPAFQFKFSHNVDVSEEGRKMMESIRDEATRIKEQMRAEKALQEQQDADADSSVSNATGRRIAKPIAKSSRFSDVHMAEFKKMDSIENHPSAFRARPGFARPTTQSLKRSSSKADLDELERPRTAGKSPSVHRPPPVTGRLTSTSPFKSVQSTAMVEDGATKRIRREGDEDVASSKPTTTIRPVSSRLLSPTKASNARAIENTSTPVKPSTIPRSNSVKSVRSITRVPVKSTPSPIKLQPLQLQKPLPPIPPQDTSSPITQTRPTFTSPESVSPPKNRALSKIPTVAALKSILRSPRKALSQNHVGTPKQTTSIPLPASSQKKVDFTPSVKSRYAVKLAEASPSPAKLDRSRMNDIWEPAIPYDSSAVVISCDTDWDNDDDDGVTYPALPNLSPKHILKPIGNPVDHTVHAFTQKAKDHGRRESKEFKSIFTTLHPKPDATSLTSVNTNLNRTNPITNAARVAASPVKAQQSSSTIRHVRTSEPVQPFEDRIQTVPHGLPGKKRRLASVAENDKYGNDDDAKENRKVDHDARVSGAWHDNAFDNDEDEGDKRGGKRARMAKVDEVDKERERSSSPVKKPSAARELAAKSAKDRKTKASIGGTGIESGSKRGVLMSRINALAKPKNRG